MLNQAYDQSQETDAFVRRLRKGPVGGRVLRVKTNIAFYFCHGRIFS